MSHASLLARARELARRYRDSVADLVAIIAEVDRLRAYAPQHTSTFEFCTKDLLLAEDEAFRMIRAARAARQRPEVLSFLAEGSLTPRAVSIIAPDSSASDFPELLERAKGKTRLEVERLMAERHPQAPSPDRIKPITADVFRFEFCADQELKRRLDRAKTLTAAKHPEGRLEDVLGEVLDVFLTSRDPLSREATERGAIRNPFTRRPPESVRDEVWRRDGGRCVFVDEAGRRCEATRFLEFDHKQPWALGGRSDDPANIRLLCRSHNQWEARQLFG